MGKEKMEKSRDSTSYDMGPRHPISLLIRRSHAFQSLARSSPLSSVNLQTVKPKQALAVQPQPAQ